MFYKPDGRGELSRTDMEEVRRGFTRLLVKRRYHPEFVFKHADELLATAHTEYVRYLNKGVEIEDPVAWMIHCAWRRLQNVLTAGNCRPQEVSSEMLAELVDEVTPTPTQIAEDADRIRKIHSAIAKLDAPQRQLVALMYFEDMALAEAARRLGWHESKARRCHDASMKRLYKSLAVKSSDQLAAEIGLVAWLSFAGSSSAFHLPAGLEAALDKAADGASGLWARAHDLVRRFTLGGGGDTATVLTISGTGRAVGACATVAVACVVGAGGIVGPGIGGIDLLAGQTDPRSGTAAHSTHIVGEVVGEPAESGDRASLARPTENSEASATTNSAPAVNEESTANSAQTETQQVQQQTDAFARAGDESAASPADSSSAAHSPAATPASHESSGSEAQTQQQFDAFK
jgi:RNA polymerase sigma factor (sigma-70 family)